MLKSPISMPAFTCEYVGGKTLWDCVGFHPFLGQNFPQFKSNIPTPPSKLLFGLLFFLSDKLRSSLAYMLRKGYDQRFETASKPLLDIFITLHGYHVSPRRFAAN